MLVWIASFLKNLKLKLPADKLANSSVTYHMSQFFSPGGNGTLRGKHKALIKLNKYTVRIWCINAWMQTNTF